MSVHQVGEFFWWTESLQTTYPVDRTIGSCVERDLIQPSGTPMSEAVPAGTIQVTSAGQHQDGRISRVQSEHLWSAHRDYQHNSMASFAKSRNSLFRIDPLGKKEIMRTLGAAHRRYHREAYVGLYGILECLTRTRIPCFLKKRLTPISAEG